MAYMEHILTLPDRTDRSYLKAEYSALVWAIPLLCQMSGVRQVVKPMPVKAGNAASSNEGGDDG